MAQGKVAAALITGMKGPKMGPLIFNFIPSFLLEPLFKVMLAREDKEGSGKYLPMRTLAPTLHHDGQLLIEMSGTLERFRALSAEVLLLGGSKSPAFQKVSLDALEKVLPHVTRVEFPGLGHAGYSHGRWWRIRQASANPLLAGFFVNGQSEQTISPWSEAPSDLF